MNMPINLSTQFTLLVDCCRKFVEEELSRRFYNHTAVALHDWQTYSQLAALAKDRLGLTVQRPDLPGLVLDPGVLLSPRALNAGSF